MSLRQIKEAKNIVIFIGGLSFMAKKYPEPFKTIGGYVLNHLETDKMEITFDDQNEIDIVFTRLGIKFPINWYEKGEDTWPDIIRVSKLIYSLKDMS